MQWFGVPVALVRHRAVGLEDVVSSKESLKSACGISVTVEWDR